MRPGVWRADSHLEDEHISRPLNLNVSPSLPRQPPLLSTSSVLYINNTWKYSPNLRLCINTISLLKLLTKRTSKNQTNLALYQKKIIFDKVMQIFRLFFQFLRYNSQTVKFNLLKHAIQWVLVYLLFTKLRNHQPCLITEYFHYPQKNPVPPGSHSPLLSSPQALSQGVCPFPIFQVDSFSLWSSVSGFFHFVCFEGSSVLQHASLFHSFYLFTSIF